MSLLEEKLTYSLRGCFYNVRNKYGNGLRESIYQKALEEELQNNNIAFISQPRIKLYSINNGEIIGYFKPDLLINNLVIVELKAFAETTKEMEMQLFNYLKISDYELGYLVNFGEIKFNPKRFIFTRDRKKFFIRNQ